MSRDILLTQIDPDPDQPRKHFDEASLKELAQSIEANGLAVPILLRPTGERFTIVHGERRYRAALLLGWESIPADVRDVSPDQARWLALAENVQRNDLTPIEEAKAYQARLQEGITQEQLGQRIGKTQSYIATKLRLLKMPRFLQYYLDRGGLTEGHCKQILKIQGIYPKGYTFETLAETGSEGVVLNTDGLPEWLVSDAWLELWPPMLGLSCRPEDQPIYHFVFADKKLWGIESILSEGTRIGISDYFTQAATGEAQVWEKAALWWASLTVYANLFTEYPISVARLSELIDDWVERLYSAIVEACIGPAKAPEIIEGDFISKMRFKLWWDVRSDIRHAGVRLKDLTEEGAAHDLLKRAFMSIENGALLLPSSWQEWGSQHNDALKYLELVTNEARSAIEALPDPESSESLEEILHIRDTAEHWQNEIAEARLRADREVGQQLDLFE